MPVLGGHHHKEKAATAEAELQRLRQLVETWRTDIQQQFSGRNTRRAVAWPLRAASERVSSVAFPTYPTPTDKNREAVDPQGDPPARTGGHFAYPGHPAGACPVLDGGGGPLTHTSSQSLCSAERH
eukprot:COSAG02_NODE_1916_length_10389_cov_4.419922_9_plen_126_part_00